MTRIRALAFSLVLVVSIIGGSVALAGGVAAAPGGMVGVPNEQVYSDLPEKTPMGQAAQEIAGAGAMTTKHADSLEVVVTSPGRAKNVIDGGVMHGSGPVSIVLTDDQNSEGRTVALPAAEIEAALGFQPEMARGTHEDGTPWNAEIEYDDGWMLVDVPHFSSNTVSFAGEVQIGEVQIGDTFADGSSTQYDIQDLDSASDVTVNLTGVSNSENESTGSELAHGSSLNVDVAGTDNASAEITISALNESWKGVSSVPGTASRTRAVSVNGSLYVVGGQDSGSLADVQKYDPSTDSWTSVASMSTHRSGPGVAVYDGEIYAIGGYDSGSGSRVASVEKYDPSTDSWSSVASMPTARSHLTAVSDGTHIYAIGGEDGSESAIVERYDPSTDSWTSVSSMPTARQYLRAVTVNGDIYAVGGSNSGSLNTVEKYDPSTDSWSSVASMQSVRTGPAVTTHNGYIYSLGGHDEGSSTYLSTVEKYEPSTDSWTSVSSMPTERGYLAGGKTAGYVFAVAGVSGGPNVGTVERYTLPNVSAPSVSIGGNTVSTSETLFSGESYTGTVEVSPGTDSATLTTDDDGRALVNISYEEISTTQDPGVELNGNESINHSGTLADGESVQYTISESALREGTNTINVSMPSLSADAPVMQTRVDYSHDAQDNQIVEYTGEKFTERYNVSKTYASDRTNPELVIDFADTAVAIRNAEYRVNGGDWQTTSDWTVENTTGTIQLPDVAAEDTIEVRVDATKVSVSNGEIQVTEPTPMGERLDTELVVTERSDGDFKLGLADSPDAKRIHYVYDQDNPDAYNHIEANGDHDLVAANAALNDVFRVSTIPVTVEPSTNDVRVSVGNPQSTEPIFNVEPGANSGDEVAFTYVDAQDDTDYVLYSQTRDVVVDSGTASSPLTLVNDDSEEALQFLIDDGESSATDGGDVTGVVGPIPDGSSVDFSGLQYVAYLIGAIILLLFVVYWFRGRDEAEEVASSASSGTASTVTGSLRWIASGIASTSNWLGSHPYIAGTLGVGAALGLFATGIFQIPQGAGVMLLVAGAPLVSWMVLRRWGDQSLVVWGGTTFVALIVGLQLLGTDLFAIVFDSQAGVIAMIGVIGLAYYALRTYQTEASTPDEQTNVSFNLESDGGRDEGGD